MKKKTIAIVVAVVLILVGGAMGAIGMNGLKWDFWELDHRQFEERTFDAATEAPDQEINKITVDVSNWKLNIVKGESISLKYYVDVRGKKPITVTVASGELKVVQQDSNKWDWQMFNFKESRLQCVLTIPEGMNLLLDVNNLNLSASDINFTDFAVESTNTSVKFTNVSANSLKVKGTNGNAVIENSTVIGALELVGTNMDISLTNATASSLTISGTNSDIELKTVEFAGILDIGGINTDIEANDVTAADIKIKSTNLDMNLNGTTANTLWIKSTNLDISSDRLNVGDIAIESVNSDIEINIAGDKSHYTIVANIVNGKIIDSQTGTDSAKKLVIKTTNCSGHVNFVA